MHREAIKYECCAERLVGEVIKGDYIVFGRANVTLARLMSVLLLIGTVSVVFRVAEVAVGRAPRATRAGCLPG